MSKIDFAKAQIRHLIEENEMFAEHFANSETNYSSGIRDGVKFTTDKLNVILENLELL